MGQALLLKGGRIIDPANDIDNQGDLLIEGGVIAGVFPGSAPKERVAGAEVVEANGKWLVPGLIDMHVHLREPGEEYKETIATGTLAAAAGGFTAVACMPNTKPANDSESVAAFILAQAHAASARVYPVGAISRELRGETLAPLGEMRRTGVVAVTDDGQPVGNSQLMRRAMEYGTNHELLVISHAEELSLSENGVMNEGALASRMGLRGIPHIAEEIMVYRDLALARYTGRPLHIAHVSTRESVDLIRRAKAQGCRVTAETAPHYFTLTEAAVDRYNTSAKMNPPLRTAEDVAAIRAGLADGTLDAIATDHAPHSELEKEVEFDLAANGIIGLETSLPLSLALVRDGVLTPRRLVEVMSCNPARILGVAGGTLSYGAVADVTMIDPDAGFVFTEADIRSKSRNSPFIGWEMQGRAVLTLLAGRVTFRR